jgi:hypothetical protein
MYKLLTIPGINKYNEYAYSRINDDSYEFFYCIKTVSCDDIQSHLKAMISS